MLEALSSYWQKSAYVAPEKEAQEQKPSRNAVLPNAASTDAKGMTLVFQRGRPEPDAELLKHCHSRLAIFFFFQSSHLIQY